MQNGIEKVKVVKVLLDCGNRVFQIEGNVPKVGWVYLDLTTSPDQTKLFADAKDNMVKVVLHQCSDLVKYGAYYAWQPRKHEYPIIPPACPRCRYRLDYRMHGS